MGFIWRWQLGWTQQKWQKLVALGLAYVRGEKHPDGWDIKGLANSTESMLQLIKGAQTSIGD